MAQTFNLNEEQRKLLIATASDDPSVGIPARSALAEAFQEPVLQTVDKISVVRNIFNVVNVPDGIASFPLDLLWNETATTLRSWIQPKQGHFPVNYVEGVDEVIVPTFNIESAVEWRIDFARACRIDVVGRAVHKMAQQIVRREDYNGWATILTAAAGLGAAQLKTQTPTTFDMSSANTIFTAMRRAVQSVETGTPTEPGKVTDLYCSPEVMEDVRGWTYTAIGTADSGNPLAPDEVTRRQIFENAGLPEIFNMRIHELNELGMGQLYNGIFDGKYSGTFATATDELVIGFDLRGEWNFVMPITRALQTADDPLAFRAWKQGVYAREDIGFAVLDDRSIVALLMGI